MKHSFIFILTLLFSLINPFEISAQAALSIGNQGGDEVVEVLVYQDEITLGGSYQQQLGTAFSFGGSDVFLQQYTLSGQLLWQYTMGSSNNDVIASLTCSPNGTLYSTGLFRDSFRLENDTILYAQQQSLFLCKHNQQGQLLWGKTLKGEGLILVNDVVSDALDNIYITGSFQDTFEVAPLHVLNGGLKSQAFLIKMDASGTVVWAKQPAYTNDESTGRALALDDTGQLYWAGHFKDELRLTNDTFQAHWSHNDLFLTLLDTQANLLWSRQYGGVYDNELNQIRWANNALYLGGNFKGVLDVDNIRLVTDFRNNWDGFLAKLNPDGTAIWGSQSKTRADCLIEDFVVTNDLVIACGNFSDSLIWNEQTAVGTGSIEAFQIAINDQGQQGILRPWKGSGFDLARANALHSSQQIITVGAFQQNLNIEGTVLQASGVLDGFLSIQIPIILPNAIYNLPNSRVNVTLFPNPVINTVEISLEEGLLERWALYSTTGQLLLEGSTKQIGLEQIVAGAYMLRIQTSKGIAVAKLIKANG